MLTRAPEGWLKTYASWRSFAIDARAGRIATENEMPENLGQFVRPLTFPDRLSVIADMGVNNRFWNRDEL